MDLDVAGSSPVGHPNFALNSHAPFTPDGRILAMLRGRNTWITLVSFPEGNELASLDTGRPLAFFPDGGQLLTTGESSRGLLLWDLRLIRQQLAAPQLGWE